MWRVSSRNDNGRWVASGPDGITGDPETVAFASANADRPVLLSPTGPAYTATGPADPVWWYLLAVGHLPAPVQVSGDRPALPSIESVDGVTY